MKDISNLGVLMKWKHPESVLLVLSGLGSNSWSSISSWEGWIAWSSWDGVEDLLVFFGWGELSEDVLVELLLDELLSGIELGVVVVSSGLVFALFGGISGILSSLGSPEGVDRLIVELVSSTDSGLIDGTLVPSNLSDRWSKTLALTSSGVSVEGSSITWDLGKLSSGIFRGVVGDSSGWDELSGGNLIRSPELLVSSNNVLETGVVLNNSPGSTSVLISGVIGAGLDSNVWSVAAGLDEITASSGHNSGKLHLNRGGSGSLTLRNSSKSFTWASINLLWASVCSIDWVSLVKNYVGDVGVSGLRGSSITRSGPSLSALIFSRGSL